MKKIKLSAREIVEFIYAGGDLTNEFSQNAELLDGTRAHQHLQNKYKEEDRKEVFVKKDYIINDFEINITGRIDGLLLEDNRLIIEEIKSTKTDLNYIEIDTRPEHLMQAKLYAYMYLEEIGKRSIYVRLTYINTLSYETKSFNKRFTKKELDTFFIETIDEYLKWFRIVSNHEEMRISSIQGLTFPFNSYREGQRDLMAATYKTILNQDILYAIAPTGIGKTIATLYSSLKAIKNTDEKIFYLTAKDVGKTVALKTVKLLEDSGLITKAIEITSKEKACFMENVDCNPEYCPYAKGFFNRLNEATQAIFTNESIYTKEIINEYAKSYTICPFEFALYLSLFSDIVICDYNYAFCPRTHLKRYFDDSNYKPILLVDEAHNMISRSKDMYSTSFDYLSVKKIKELTKGLKPSITNELKVIVAILDIINEQLEKVTFYKFDLVNPELITAIRKVINKLDTILIDNKEMNRKKELLDIYFMLFNFLRINEYYTNAFIFTVEKDSFSKVANYIYSIKCLDASEYVLKTIKEKTIGTIFFSATLFPLYYYRKLLTQDYGEYIHLPSPFKQDHLNLLIVDDTSTRYQDRNNSIKKVIDVIHTMVSHKAGNYIVFFPSFEYLNLVLGAFLEEVHDYEIIMQRRVMSSDERNEVLEAFNQNDQKTRIAFFVMGGLFAEGIDYVGDMLSGVLIVGVGMPAVSDYNNILKSYFDEKFKNGFDYAYTYPGITKIIQAVGRVIRTDEDRGIAILLDDRFSSKKYQNLFPIEWNHFKVINDVDILADNIELFWDRED